LPLAKSTLLLLPTSYFLQLKIMEEQLVIFRLNNEAYGINVAQVQSIIPLPDIVTIPGAPSFIEGVINLRGAVVPVVDLRTRFGLPPLCPP